MKTAILTLFLLVSINAVAQKKPLPAQCPGLEQTLQLIKQNFSNLAKFKKSPKPGKTDIFLTSMSICGVNGELEIFGGGAELSFKFTTEQFRDDEDKLLPAFVAHLRKAIKKVFGSDYEETTEKDVDELWGAYQTISYQPYTGLYPNIEINYPFADDFCWIRFVYDK